MHACQVALVLLLFGSSCTCLSVIQETATRAVSELSGSLGEDFLPRWLSDTPAGQATLLSALTATILLPLSLVSMGELFAVSLLGVGIMVVLCVYVIYLAVTVNADAREQTVLVRRSSELLAASMLATAPEEGTPGSSGVLTSLGVPTAASTFGYAFYIQPCALPLLRSLPAGDIGAQVLIKALHVTFAFTACAYLIVGLGGLAVFGAGHVPQDLMQGFKGQFAGFLSGLFSLYLCLCFPPILVPLREILVRLLRRQGLHPTPRRRRTADASTVTLPPVQNALLTALLVGAALCVALLLSDASSTLFALTGATGVCCVSYILPIYAYWSLDEAEGGVLRRSLSNTSLPTGTSASYGQGLGGVTQGAHGAGSPLGRWLAYATRHWKTWILERAWPAAVLVLGSVVSILTLAGVLGGGIGGGASC